LRSTATLRWLGLALLGLAVAAVVSVAASRLVSQQIGIASEPISAGDALAPVAARRPVHRTPAPDHRGPATNPQPQAPSTAPETTAPEPSSHGDGDEDGGGGEEADD
jgi:hypothetical protein